MAGEYAVIETNLRHMMRFFSGASDAGELREMPGVSIVSSGLDYGVLNSAALSREVTGGQVELERRIAIPEVHFRMRGLRWSYWVCEDMIENPLRRRAKEIFLQRGFRVLTEPPGMIAERLSPPARSLPPLEIRRVADPASRFDFAHIVSVCFELPFQIARATYTREDVWQGEVTGYVGYSGNTAVCTAAITPAAGVIGVYSVGTLPDSRRRGYAEAIIRHAVAETSAQTGLERTILQSTRDGLSLYESMGYRTVTRFWVMTPFQ